MKQLLEMKGKIATEVKEIESAIAEYQSKGNYTGITMLNIKLEGKKDLLRLINIIYPLV